MYFNIKNAAINVIGKYIEFNFKLTLSFVQKQNLKLYRVASALGSSKKKSRIVLTLHVIIEKQLTFKINIKNIYNSTLTKS